MIRSGRDRLCGRVEIDETNIGGRKKGARGRGAEGKSLVLVAVEGVGGKLGRIRFRCVAAADADHIELFANDYVEPESNIVTDGLASYSGLSSLGFVTVLMCFHLEGRMRERNSITFISWCHF